MSRYSDNKIELSEYNLLVKVVQDLNKKIQTLEDRNSELRDKSLADSDSINSLSWTVKGQQSTIEENQEEIKKLKKTHREANQEKDLQIVNLQNKHLRLQKKYNKLLEDLKKKTPATRSKNVWFL